jgi:uncharacterized UBP type Zn finger protein
MPKSCNHLANIKIINPRTEGCEECLQSGDSWVSLRWCLTCGHVGCCNNSKNKHAQKHFAETQHPVMQVFGEEEDWKWCYIDKTYIGKRPSPVKIISKIIRRKLFHYS